MTQNKKNKELRKWEYLTERRCLICGNHYVTKIYWAYGGTKPSHSHWVIASVYCSTKCLKKGHKMFREDD